MPPPAGRCRLAFAPGLIERVGSRLGVVFVSVVAANSNVSHILLHVGGGPASERGEVAEAGDVVIMSVPERIRFSTRIGTPHDWVPLAGTCVDPAVEGIAGTSGEE